MAVDVASSSSGTANATSVSCTLPSSVASGDLLLLFAAGSDASPGGAVLSNSDGTYTLLATANHIAVDGPEETLACWYKTAGSSESAPTVSNSGAGALAFVFYRITGQHASSNPEKATADATINPPNLAPSWGSDAVLWVAAAAGRNGTAVSAYPTGYADDQLNPLTTGGTGANDQSLGVATKTATASSDNPAAFTGPGSRIAAMTIAVRQAAAAATTKRLAALGVG